MSNLLNHFNARQQAILDAIRLLVEQETTSREEARLKGAAQDGGDVILYVMRREECPYVEVPPTRV